MEKYQDNRGVGGEGRVVTSRGNKKETLLGKNGEKKNGEKQRERYDGKNELGTKEGGREGGKKRGIKEEENMYSGRKSS